METSVSLNSPTNNIWKEGKGKLKSLMDSYDRIMNRSNAQLWQYIYRLRNHGIIWLKRYASLTLCLLFSVGFLMSWMFSPAFQKISDPFFSTPDNFKGFQTLLVTLGSALVGATAIAFSLIMFAMQVNVERMPHGLFRKFSSDRKLLGAFATTFILAISITTLSLIPDKSWVILAVFMGSWGTLLIVVLFLYAYRRALRLISPTEQLVLIVAGIQKNLRAWVKAAKRAEPLIVLPSQGNQTDDGRLKSEHDMARFTYLQLNPSWTARAQQGILHCISFARRYAEHGDNEVSQIALNAIVAINADYISAKGKTFFTRHHLVDNPYTTDGFFNETLEHLRQNVQVGVSRGDEQQIEQTFNTIASLCKLYLSIDYSMERGEKHHAHLAAGYLKGAVESIVPHNMPDVLMEGVRLMGETALMILTNNEPEHIAGISEKIGLISCTGAVNEKYRPVTQVGVSQLAKLTFYLIRSESHDIKFAAEDVRNDVKLIAEIYLKTPDTPLSSIHSSSLGPYYSGTSSDSLLSWLTNLTSAVSDAQADEEDAKRVVRHIQQWADGIYRTEKDLLLLAIEKKSHFAFDIIHWISHITKLLLAVSNAPACDDHTRNELRKSALFLISVLSWIPDKEEAVRFVECYQLTEILFEAAIDAHQRDCREIALKIRGLLLSWAFKAGKYQTGFGTFERACYGLACLNIIFDLDDTVLLSAINDRVGQEGAPSPELRFSASEDIREKAEDLRHDRFELGAIESVMAQVDQGKLRILLIGVADRLAPEVTRQGEQ